MKENKDLLDKLKEEARARKLSHPQTDEFLKQNYYWKFEDPTFNPNKNRSIIEGTIKKHEANIKRKNKAYKEAIDERTEAVMSWVKKRLAGSDTPIEKYFSSQMMAYLKAEQVRSVRKKNGLSILTSSDNERR